MSLIVKTTYHVREAQKASFLADFSVVAQATMAAPACDWIYVAEDLEEDTVVAMSYWQSEAGFDDHLRWRIGTSRWTEMEQKYLEGEPEYKLMPVMFRFRDHS
jgi:quinol monooxygenase YgiN